MLTREGRKTIESIVAGDEVLAAHDADPAGVLTWQRVERVYHNAPAHLWNVHIGCERRSSTTPSPLAGEGWGEGGCDTVIRATDNHPWYVVGRGWVSTVDLRIGHRLRTADGSLAVVTDKFDNGDVEPVFNLCVANAHTYFVGDEHCAVLVHNASNECEVSIAKQFLDSVVNAGDYVNPLTCGPKLFNKLRNAITGGNGTVAENMRGDAKWVADKIVEGGLATGSEWAAWFAGGASYAVEQAGDLAASQQDTMGQINGALATVEKYYNKTVQEGPLDAATHLVGIQHVSDAIYHVNSDTKQALRNGETADRAIEGIDRLATTTLVVAGTAQSAKSVSGAKVSGPTGAPNNVGSLRSRMGEPPAGMLKPQAHHDLPQKFASKFEAKGIDINDPAYGRWVEGGPVGNHQKWSAAFNKEWERFFAKSPEATREQIIDKMNQLRTDPRFQ